MLSEIPTRWTAGDGSVDVDGMRREYIVKLHALTGRNVVTYYTNWMQPGSPDVSIVLSDINGLMEVFKDLDPKLGLDLVLHSPGGDPTAADSLVRYMRQKFTDVRVIVPVAAMSAATMWALSGDRILMGKHSQLGPIDPQLLFPHAMVPAGAIARTFQRAQDECSADATKLSAWVPTLQQYFPGLLDMCDDSTKLARSLAEEYLLEHMFQGRPDGPELAAAAAEFFADDQVHIAHGRGIHRDALVELKLEVDPLEGDNELQDAVLSVHHAYMHTFAMTPTTKIIENQIGRAMIKTAVMQMPMMQMPLVPQP